MSKHTKGPWIIIENPTNISIATCACEEGGHQIAFVPGGAHKPYRRANARLMAAAPELYEAAVDFLHGYCKESSEAFHERMSNLAFRFRMATNKAEGKR